MFLRILLLFSICTPLMALEQGQARRAVEEPAIDGTSIKKKGQKKVPGYVFDITVQNVEQLDAIFNRADKLKGQFSPNQHGRIALVLHGSELQLFRKQNYKNNIDIVEKARLLDQQNLIDIKACQTAMQSQHIDLSELPDFIEQVPLAPVEIERLEKEQGYTRL